MIIEGPYLRDILDQPLALEKALDHLSEGDSLAAIASDLAAGRYQRVLLTGMGSSLHALYPLHLALSRHGYASFWVETAELLLGFDALRKKDTLLIAVSQSGESAEIVNLLLHAGEFGHVIGVTNNEHSPLGRQADTRLLLRSGTEFTVSCKSYLNTLAVLHWLGVLLCGGRVAGAMGELRIAWLGVKAYLPRWRDHVSELLAQIQGVQSVFITGRGESLATAGTAGLILKESTHVHAEGMSCASFRHGPMEMANENSWILVFAGDRHVEGLNRRLFEDISRGGGRAAWISLQGASAPVFQLPETCRALQPIVEILPVQMLTLALAARDKREAGRFERASKITKTE